MSTPSTSPLTALRGSLWGFLVFAGVAWLAVGWSVLRLEPTDVARVAGPIIVFGALMEALRALGGGRMWGLHAGMAALFAVTGGLILADDDTTYTTPAALIGWFLMVRGAADVVMSVMSRGLDRTWALVLALGVAQVGLGFYAASRFARSGEVVILLLGGLALARAIADLVGAMSLREAPVAAETPREHAAGVAGYAAGLADYAAAAAATARSARPRHRAVTAPVARSGDDDAVLEIGEPVSTGQRHTPGEPAEVPDVTQAGPERTPDPVETTAILNSLLASAGMTPAGTTSDAAQAEKPGSVAGLETPEITESAETPDRELATAGAGRPATMFTGPHHVGELSSGQGAAAYRVPAGPAAGMPVHGGAADAATGADLASTAMVTESGSAVRAQPSMSVGAAVLPEVAGGAGVEGAERPPQASRSGLFWRSKGPGRRRAL